MKTFILIHGSWHSSWNWHKVAPLLENAGYIAISIDLPGMGRDKTPIQDVKLEILVGHNKNVIVISQVAEYRPQKIEKLIYLAAYLIPNGKSQREYSVQDTEGWLKPYVTQHPETNSHTLQSIIFKQGLYHDCDDDITEMAKCILSNEPVESGIAPLNLSEENYGSVPRYYIECTEDRAVTPFIQKIMYTETPCKKVYSMDTSHSPFFSKPSELTEFFCEIAETHEVLPAEINTYEI